MSDVFPKRHRQVLGWVVIEDRLRFGIGLRRGAGLHGGSDFFLPARMQAVTGSSAVSACAGRAATWPQWS